MIQRRAEPRYSARRRHVARAHFHQIVPANIDRDEIRVIFQDVVSYPAQCKLGIVAFDSRIVDFEPPAPCINHPFKKSPLPPLPPPPHSAPSANATNPLHPCATRI